MPRLVFDIETIPTQDGNILSLLSEEHHAACDAEISAVSAPSNYRDPVKISAYCDAQRAKIKADYAVKRRASHEATSLDGLGHICAIGWAVDDEPVVVEMAETPQDEPWLLNRFFDELLGAATRTPSPLLLVGHNLIGFDIPFMWRRSFILGIDPAIPFPRDPKPWLDGRTFDTMLEWAGKRGPYLGLSKLARILGVETSQAHRGDEIAALMATGRFEDVRAKCANDVETTRAIYRRMTFAPAVVQKAVNT